MSVEAFSAVLNHSQAKGTDKVILLGIAWHLSTDPELGCWASQETLASYANCSVRQVRRAITNLVEIEELEVVIHGGNNYGQIRPTNRYFVRLDCPETCDSTVAHSYTQLSPQLSPQLTDKLAEADIHDRQADIYDLTGGHLWSDRRTLMSSKRQLNT
jgi:hypothetical protein